MGSLPDGESDRLIDAFSFTAWRDDPGGKLRPVITHPARVFLKEATSGLPYLLQVACYHIYDRSTRADFPLINKALCRRVILTKVLREIAEYLEHQWAQIPDAARKVILDSLAAMPKDPDEFLRFFDRWKGVELDMPPGSFKALDRSGLRGDDGYCVAPLVAAWLLSNESH